MPIPPVRLRPRRARRTGHHRHPAPPRAAQRRRRPDRGGARRRLPCLRGRRRGPRRGAPRRRGHLLLRSRPDGPGHRPRQQRPPRRRPSADGPMGPTRMRLTKPVIAAIEGYAVAGGLELALWADLRVVAEDATLGVFCRRWGVPLIDGGTVRLPRIVGRGRRGRPRPDRPSGRRRRGAADRVGDARRALRHHPRGGRAAGRRAGGLPADDDAPRPGLDQGAARPRRDRRPGQRAPPRRASRWPPTPWRAPSASARARAGTAPSAEPGRRSRAEGGLRPSARRRRPPRGRRRCRPARRW